MFAYPEICINGNCTNFSLLFLCGLFFNSTTGKLKQWKRALYNVLIFLSTQKATTIFDPDPWSALVC